MPKRRIDALLAERGLVGSRTSAAESVRAGRVRIGRDGPRAEKPGQLVAEDAELTVAEPPPYVSRGGIKLENALDALAIEVSGLRCLDVGASTGGFTDCLLKRGAERVIALDVAGPARLGPAQRPAGRGDRAPQRARPRRGRAVVRRRPRDGRRLVHLGCEGARPGRRLRPRGRRASGAGEATVRARPRAGRQGRRGPRSGRPTGRAAGPPPLPPMPA